MISKYDVFYVIAIKGEIKIIDIVRALHKPKSEYDSIFKRVQQLEKEGYVKKDNLVKIVHNERTKDLFKLISFCISNSINYNLIFKKSMLNFIQKAARKEFFTIKDIKIHPQTFKFYVDTLLKYGLLLILSRKPLKCRILEHHFLINLLKFFKIKAKFHKHKHHSLIKEIKKELRKYKKNLEINRTEEEDLEKKKEVDFIYTSLHLEGNPLTLSETQKLIFDEVLPEKHKLSHVEEVTNYKKAVDLMIENAKNKVKLTLPLILEYHKIGMAHIHGAGEIRKQNVRIKFNPHFKTSNWNLIGIKLDLLLKEYEKFSSNKNEIDDVIEFASFFHNEFQRIHPFIDGNSRTSRLLMLHILRFYELPVLDLPLGFLDYYMDLTKRSKKRDDKAFRNLIEEVVLVNFKSINFKF